MEIKIQLLTDKAQLPTYETPGSAGMDIRADLSRDRRARNFGDKKNPLMRLMIYPGCTERVAGGFALEIPQGFEAQLRPRSGLASRGLVIPNSPGTIDSDYRGEVCVLLRNTTEDPWHIEHGERIGQLVFAPVTIASLIPVAKLSDTRRGHGGFGHTGTK